MGAWININTINSLIILLIQIDHNIVNLIHHNNEIYEVSQAPITIENNLKL